MGLDVSREYQPKNEKLRIAAKYLAPTVDVLRSAIEVIPVAQNTNNNGG